MIRPYMPGDMWPILADLRQSELDESALLGVNPEENIRYGVENGETITLEINGEIMGIAGVVPRETYSVPWSVFTPAICKHPVAFLRECKRWLSRYDGPMMNVIDDRNVQGQKWLKWLGFTVGEPENGIRRYWRD